MSCVHWELGLLPEQKARRIVGEEMKGLGWTQQELQRDRDKPSLWWSELICSGHPIQPAAPGKLQLPESGPKGWFI
jgi:hypothetical protein